MFLISARETNHGKGITNAQAARREIQRTSRQSNGALRYSKSFMDKINIFIADSFKFIVCNQHNLPPKIRIFKKTADSLTITQF